VDPADIAYVVQPPSEGRASDTFIVRATVRNLGDADVYGAVVDLMAVGDVSRGPFMRRERVVDLPAGASVMFVQNVTYPAGYGTFLVQVKHSGDSSQYSEMLALDDPWHGVAFRVLNLKAAPDGYAREVADGICANQCRGY
jgi:hypothetical protein